MFWVSSRQEEATQILPGKYDESRNNIYGGKEHHSRFGGALAYIKTKGKGVYLMWNQTERPGISSNGQWWLCRKWSLVERRTDDLQILHGILYYTVYCSMHRSTQAPESSSHYTSYDGCHHHLFMCWHTVTSIKFNTWKMGWRYEKHNIYRSPVGSKIKNVILKR